MVIKTPPKPIRNSFPTPPAPKMFRNIAVTFVVITVVVISIAMWTSSVKAFITVKTQKKHIQVATDVNIGSVSADNQIRGVVVDTYYTEPKEYLVKASKIVPEVKPEPSKTKGRVRIVNNYSKDQPLVVKTRLLTKDNKLFRILKTVKVPAGGSVEVEAISDKEGFEFEIKKGEKMLIPGLWKGLQDKIYAQSITDFKGKHSVSGPQKIVTAKAVSDAYDELYKKAFDKAKAILIEEAGADPMWEKTFIVNKVEKQTNAEIGQNTDRFLAKVKIYMTGVFFPKEDVVSLIRSKGKDKLPDGYTIMDIDVNQLKFDIKKIDKQKGLAELKVSSMIDGRLTANSALLKKDLIVGLPQDEVIRKWSALDGVDEVDVELKPSWVNRLPSMKDKITVTVE